MSYTVLIYILVIYTELWLSQCTSYHSIYDRISTRQSSPALMNALYSHTCVRLRFRSSKGDLLQPCVYTCIQLCFALYQRAEFIMSMIVELFANVVGFFFFCSKHTTAKKRVGSILDFQLICHLHSGTICLHTWYKPLTICTRM